MLYGEPETYIDGYGKERQHASLEESANGQELQRMGDTAKTAGKIALTGAAFTNPVTAAGETAALMGTLGQAYFLGEGLKDAKYRIENGSTAEDGAMLALDLLPAASTAKTLANGTRQVGRAVKNAVDETARAQAIKRTDDVKTTTAVKVNTRPLSMSERLGIPKGDRGNLSQEQLEALQDVESYLTRGRHFDKFVYEPNSGIFT